MAWVQMCLQIHGGSHIAELTSEGEGTTAPGKSQDAPAGGLHDAKCRKSRHRRIPPWPAHLQYCMSGGPTWGLGLPWALPTAFTCPRVSGDPSTAQLLGGGDERPCRGECARGQAPTCLISFTPNMELIVTPPTAQVHAQNAVNHNSRCLIILLLIFILLSIILLINKPSI